MSVKTTAGLLAATLGLAAAAPADELARLDGEYRYAFAHGAAPGRPETNALTVVRYDRRHAFVTTSLEYADGAACGFYGMGRWTAPKLVLRRTDGGAQCVLTLTASRSELRLTFEGDGCRTYCGEDRGFTPGAVVARAGRRPVANRESLVTTQAFKDSVDTIGQEP